jgi:hypothetical protein
MAQTLKYDSEIQQGATIQSWHVSQSVDAFTGTEAYDITLSGSFTTEGNILHELNNTQTLSIQNFPPRGIVNTSDLKSEFVNAANLVMEKGQSDFPFNTRNKTLDIDGNFRNGGFIGIYNGTTSTNTANIFMHSDVDNALIKLNGEEDNGNKYFELNHDSNNTISYFTLNSTSTTLSNTRFRINADYTNKPTKTLYVIGDSHLEGDFLNDGGGDSYFTTLFSNDTTSAIYGSARTVQLGDFEGIENETTLEIKDSTQAIILQAINGVGINTQPTTTLDVNGSGRFTGDVEVTGSLTISGSSTFTNIGPTVLNGSVGVNTSSPSTDFEVNGDIKSNNLEVGADVSILRSITTPTANVQSLLNLKDIGDLNNINSPKRGDITQVSGVLYFHNGEKWFSLSMTAVE